MSYYGGVEGGTTGSRMVIVDEQGKVYGRAEGPHTNFWHLGFEKAAKRIVALYDAALKDAELPPETTLKSLGLSLSGLNSKADERNMVDAVKAVRPSLADDIYACNDAIGTLATATDKDAIVLIAGTGSICKLIRSSLSFIRIGGLGYLLGDEGSAFWVAHQAVMCFIKIKEGYFYTPYSTKKLEKTITQYFGIEHHHELLPFFSEKFDKTFTAALCKELAKVAQEGDMFCRQLFFDAGQQLGRHVSVAMRYAEKEGLMKPEGLDVICCGSLFKSWHLVEAGFRAGLKPRSATDVFHGRIFLRQLMVSAAYGAAIVAAKLICDVNIPRPSDATSPICELIVPEDDPFRFP
ncbi:unnamed protein product [Calicophoron daubneyi]|uniref:N-acetyl-D-glucosamine kinase n=1 Tax=Calicophoron daubneyi TaxID=300641 RepID=A0AAV2TMD6_CALDB